MGDDVVPIDGPEVAPTGRRAEPPLPVKAYQRAPTLMAGSSKGPHGDVRVWAPRRLLLLAAAGPHAFAAGPAFLAALLFAVATIVSLYDPMHGSGLLIFFLLTGLAALGFGIEQIRKARRLVRPMYLTTDEDGMAVSLPDGGTQTIRWDSIALVQRDRTRDEIAPGHPAIFLRSPDPVTISLVGYSRAQQEELYSLINSRAGRRQYLQLGVWPNNSQHPFRSPSRRPAIAVRWSQLSALAQAAFRAAEQYGRDSGPTLITPEHLLAGLAEPGSPVAALLAQHGIGEGSILATIERRTGEEDAPRADPLGMSVRTNEVLRLAASEAEGRFIGPEHLLLGIARQRGGGASDLLLAHGLGPVRLRHAMDEIAGCETGTSASETGTSAGDDPLANSLT